MEILNTSQSVTDYGIDKFSSMIIPIIFSLVVIIIATIYLIPKVFIKKWARIVTFFIVYVALFVGLFCLFENELSKGTFKDTLEYTYIVKVNDEKEVQNLFATYSNVTYLGDNTYKLVSTDALQN